MRSYSQQKGLLELLEVVLSDQPFSSAWNDLNAEKPWVGLALISALTLISAITGI